MKRIVIGMLLLVWAGLVLAASPASVRKRMEASMLVNGQIEVDAQGGVTGYELDQRDKLPDVVQAFIDASITGWRFEPSLVDGQAVAIRNRMGLLLVAEPMEDGNFRIRLRSTSFYPLKEAGYELESVVMDPPNYPMMAAESGVSGTVYLVLQVGTDGRVADVAAEQVNLRFVASEVEMKRWRSVLAKNAIAKARQWTFRPPQHGELADDGSWSVRVPVAYSFERSSHEYGRWLAYIPGPRQHAPWVIGDDVAPDALADGRMYPVGGSGGLRLLGEAGG